MPAAVQGWGPPRGRLPAELMAKQHDSGRHGRQNERDEEPGRKASARTSHPACHARAHHHVQRRKYADQDPPGIAPTHHDRKSTRRTASRSCQKQTEPASCPPMWSAAGNPGGMMTPLWLSHGPDQYLRCLRLAYSQSGAVGSALQNAAFAQNYLSLRAGTLATSSPPRPASGKARPCPDWRVLFSCVHEPRRRPARTEPCARYPLSGSRDRPADCHLRFAGRAMDGRAQAKNPGRTEGCRSSTVRSDDPYPARCRGTVGTGAHASGAHNAARAVVVSGRAERLR